MSNRCRTAVGLAPVVAGLLAAGSLWLGAPAPAAAAAGEDARQVRITRQRPPCSNPSGMPIVPNDPGALVTPGGTRCYGTRPPELELWLPQDRFVWLEQRAPNPAAWIDLGLVEVDPLTLEPPPLGLRLSRSDDAWTLETRYGQAATLTRLEAGAWQQIDSPDGQRFWVRLGAAGDGPGTHGDGRREGRTLGQGRVRYRAD